MVGSGGPVAGGVMISNWGKEERGTGGECIETLACGFTTGKEKGKDFTAKRKCATRKGESQDVFEIARKRDGFHKKGGGINKPEGIWHNDGR